MRVRLPAADPIQTLPSPLSANEAARSVCTPDACQTLGVFDPGRQIIQSRFGPNPQSTGVVAQGCPHNVVAEPVIHGVCFPPVLAHPAHQPVPDHPDPKRAFAVNEQVGDVVTREPVHGCHHPPWPAIPNPQGGSLRGNDSPRCVARQCRIGNAVRSSSQLVFLIPVVAGNYLAQVRRPTNPHVPFAAQNHVQPAIVRQIQHAPQMRCLPSSRRQRLSRSRTRARRSELPAHSRLLGPRDTSARPSSHREPHAATGTRRCGPRWPPGPAQPP